MCHLMFLVTTSTFFEERRVSDIFAAHLIGKQPTETLYIDVSELLGYSKTGEVVAAYIPRAPSINVASISICTFTGHFFNFRSF